MRRNPIGGLAALVICIAMVFGSLTGVASAQVPTVNVNGEKLSKHQIDGLVSLYGGVYPGDYWYDPMSGLYGNVGQPASGQLAPGLAIGGALKPSASGGGNGRVTGVFINGREIHPQEHAFLTQIFGQAAPGRYWMNAAGIGGYEGGPAMFNIVAAAQQAAARQNGGQGGGSTYLPGIGGKPGTHVGRASDGCLYVSQGSYSADFC